MAEKILGKITARKLSFIQLILFEFVYILIKTLLAIYKQYIDYSFVNQNFCSISYLRATCYHLTYNKLFKSVSVPLLLSPPLIGTISALIYYYFSTIFVEKKASLSKEESPLIRILPYILVSYVMFDILFDFPILRGVVGGYNQYHVVPTMIYGATVIAIVHSTFTLGSLFHRGR